MVEDNEIKLDLANKKILLTGGAGFLGKYINEELLNRGAKQENIFIPRSKDTDLRTKENCDKVVKNVDIVIHLAAAVGGIGYNQKFPGSLFYDNLMMGVQLIEAAREVGVKKFVAIGTICAYPKFAPVPFKEKDLWNGYPEETNAPYGLAKKMMLVQTQAYRQQYGFNGIYLLPVNLYGPGDNFNHESSHVIPALIRKIHNAKLNNDKNVEVWGTGSATREFLFVKDAAEGIVKAALSYDGSEPVNLGAGNEISIKDLAETIIKIMDYDGEIKWLTDKPDGQPRRKLDTTKAKEYFGFESKTKFDEGLRETIKWYKNNCN